VPERNGFEAATIRVVPRVEREEFINVGVVLYCRARGYLAARIALDEQRLRALAPDLTGLDEIRRHLDHLLQVCDGGPAAGPIGELSQAERFQWIVSPRSTVIQPSPPHSGLCDDPAVMLDHLMQKLVTLPAAPA
jgi:hypothetical protein